MFHFLKRDDSIKSVYLKSICVGKIIPMEEVPDKMFARKVMGDGIGFDVESGRIYSPCDGEVLMVADTKHAIGIKAKNGAEILIHIGMDTVNLGGEGLRPLVAEGDSVKEGQVLMEVDMDVMMQKNVCMISPMICTNLSDFDLNVSKNSGDVGLSDIVFSINRKH